MDGGTGWQGFVPLQEHGDSHSFGFHGDQAAVTLGWAFHALHVSLVALAQPHGLFGPEL